MKAHLLSLLCLFGFLLFFSCKKEKSFENFGNTSLTAQWQFSQGKVFKGKVDTAYIDVSGGASLATLYLQGTSDNGAQLLSIQIGGINTTAPGSYSTPQIIFTYESATNLIYSNDLSITGGFTVVITKIDSAGVSGSFSGSVRDSTGTSKLITDGRFTARLKNTSAGNGQATFWATQSCVAGGNITIKLSNSNTGTITTFTPTEPACGSSGTASFTLPAGTYTWKAYCGSVDSTYGVITVNANQCTKQEVLFNAGNNCRISDLAFYDINFGIPVGTLRTSYDANNQPYKIELIDSVNHVVANTFNISYPAGQVKINTNQYFLLEPAGKISEYHGFLNPTDTTSSKVIMKYYYDANGYMNKATMEYVDTPGVIKWQGLMEYLNSNLSKITETDPSVANSGKRISQFVYGTKTVRNFIYFIPSAEIILFQSVINPGKNSTNAVNTETVTIDSSGVIISTQVTNYQNYTVDPVPNSYVRSFSVTGAGSNYGTNYKYILSYKCF